MKEKARDVVWLTLRIQGYRHLIPFLELPLGRYDVILGLKWLAATGVNVCCAKRQLIWPT